MKRSPEELRAFLAQLEADDVDPDALLRNWQADRRATDLSEALRRAALTPHFDADLFSLLTQGLENVTFKELIALPEVRPLPRRAGYTVTEAARESLIQEWRQIPEYVSWNQQLADFVKDHDPDDVATRLYYLVRCDIHGAKKLFEEEFAKADARFDLSRCFALLEVLAHAQAHLGTELTLSREIHQQRYRALALFAGDYYRTRTYQQRAGVLAVIEEVFASDTRWILHLHATGGMGKTMFLRWFITDQLLAKRRACARVDFDDVNASNVTRFPWLLLLAFAEQLNVQMERRFFLDLIEQLTPFASFLRLPQELSLPDSVARQQLSTTSGPEWVDGAQFVAKFAAILRESDTQVVLVLDTLEGVTVTAEFAPIFSLLRDVRARAPNVRVILSGRYNIPSKIKALLREADEQRGPSVLPGTTDVETLTGVLNELNASSLSLELRRFTKKEAQEYLRSRGIIQKEIVEAIIAKVHEAGGEGSRAAGINPFNLSLFAELVLGRDAISADEVRRLPSAHFVYLVERVIKRIPEQPLRWVVRYGALPRRLTPGFIDAVLRGPLEAALRGEFTHDVLRVQTRGTSEIRETDLWKPDLSAGTSGLWEQLCRYEAPRGWIWREPGTEQAVRFHGDVVEPMRDLLSTQPVFPDLQRRAVTYFEELAHAEPGRWADWICEAIFHKFQLERDSAAPYWEEQLRVAGTKGHRGWPRQVAREVLRLEYAEDGVNPRLQGEPPEELLSTATLVRAHLETAQAMLTELGPITPGSADWPEFRRHILAARRLAADSRVVGRSVAVAQFDAAERVARGDYGSAEKILSCAAAVEHAPGSFALRLQLAQVLGALRDPRTPGHYLAAIQSHPGPSVTGVGLVDLHLELAHWYLTEGQTSRAGEVFESALAAAREAGDAPATVRVLLFSAWSSLRLWDFDRASGLADAARYQAPNDPQLRRLDAWLAFASGDPESAVTTARQAVDDARDPGDEARARDILAKAHAERMDFSVAFAEWERAIALFTQVPAPNAIESCIFDRMTVEGRVAENHSAARASLLLIGQLPGMRDVEIATRVNLEKLFVEIQTGQRDASRDTFRLLSESREPALPAVLRARVLCHGLAFGLVSPDDTTLDELIDLLLSVEPASARTPLVDAFRYCEEVAASAKGRERLLSLFQTPSRGTRGFAVAALHVGEVHRAFGASKQARELLESALDDTIAGGNFWGAIQAWRSLRRIDRTIALPQRAHVFMDPFGPPPKSFAEAAMILELFPPQVTRANARGLQQLLERVRPALDEETFVTRWHAEHATRGAEVAANLDEGVLSTALASMAQDLYGDLGNPQKVAAIEGGVTAAIPDARSSQGAREDVTPTAGRRVTVQLGAAGSVLRDGERRSYDSFAEQIVSSGDASWFGDWLEPRIDALSAPSTQFRLELPAGRPSALPWEWLCPPGTVYRGRRQDGPFARELVLWVQQSLAKLGYRILMDGFLGPQTERAILDYARDKRLDTQLMGPGVIAALRADVDRNGGASVRILVVKPKTEYEEVSSVSHESRAGVSIEDFYRSAGGRDLSVLESPGQEALFDAMKRTAPALVHFVCAVTETGGLPALTFDRSRSDTMVTRSFVTARSLASVLQSRKRTWPFIVLDVARPSSAWDAARCMLLRNHLASELFAIDGIGGVLATGLASSRDIHELSEQIANYAKPMRSQQEMATAVQSLFRSGDDESRRLAFRGTALFSSEPELPCLLGNGDDTARRS